MIPTNRSWHAFPCGAASEVKAILDEAPSTPGPDSSDFWILVAALKEHMVWFSGTQLRVPPEQSKSTYREVFSKFDTAESVRHIPVLSIVLSLASRVWYGGYTCFFLHAGWRRKWSTSSGRFSTRYDINNRVSITVDDMSASCMNPLSLGKESYLAFAERAIELSVLMLVQLSIFCVWA